MHTGVSSYWVVWYVHCERYTRVIMEASPEFPIYFLKIYSCRGKYGLWADVKEQTGDLKEGFPTDTIRRLGTMEASHAQFPESTWVSWGAQSEYQVLERDGA